MISARLSSLAGTTLLKPAFDRTRPWLVFKAIKQFLPDPGDASFPSGHSANAMGPAWGMLLASMPVKIKMNDSPRMLRSYDAVPCLGWNGAGVNPQTVHRFSIAAVILAVLIGISRLYLGMHYPSDVICGLLVGMVCATAVCYVITLIEKKRGRVLGAKKDV